MPALRRPLCICQLRDVYTDDLGTHRRRERPRFDVVVRRRVTVEFSGRMESHGSILLLGLGIAQSAGIRPSHFEPFSMPGTLNTYPFFM